MRLRNIFAAIVAVFTTVVICYGVESLSIQQMFQSSPKETAPQGATRVLTVRGGVVRQMSYSSVHPVATNTIAGAVKPDGSTTTVDIDGTLHGTPYPNPGIPYSLGNGWGIAFTPSNKIPANYVALPVLPQSIGPLTPGYHLNEYNASTGLFGYSADASVGGASDPNAIHSNAAGEIAGVTAKATPAGADIILIESAADGNTKRSVRVDSLPYQPPGSYLQSSAIGSTVQGHTAALDAVTGTNTGDETQATIKAKLGAAGPGDGYLTAAQYVTLSNALQPGASTTGNAGTATKLATPRTINGVNFDGSANITINAVDSTARLAATAQAVDSAKLATVTPSANALTLIGHTFSQMVTDLSTALNAAYHGLTILGSEVTTALGFTPENVANKSTNVAADGASDTKYPSAKAVKDYVDASVISGGVSSATFAAYTSIDRLAADNPTYTGTLTSNSADGTHFVQPYNSVAFSGTPSEGMLQTTAAGLLQQYHSGAWQTVTGSGSGTVTSITASSPLTGGTITGSGTIGIPAATSSVSGYLTSTDWATFNGKQANLISGTNIKTVGGVSLIGGGGTDIGVIGTSYGGTGANNFSFSGTQHQVASISGTKTAGKQITFDSSGNLIASAYDVGASGGGGGSGIVSNSSNAYRLAGYAAAGTTVSDSGITYATDGTTITTVQSASNPDSLTLRTSSANGSNGVSLVGPSSATSGYAIQFPATAPTAGQIPIFGTPVGSTVPVTYGANSGGITALTGDVTASGTGSVAATVAKIQGYDTDSAAPSDGDVWQYSTSSTKWLHVTAATLKSSLSLSNVENTALSTWAGSTNITTLGTIASGTVPVARVSGLPTFPTGVIIGATDTQTLTNKTLTAPVVTNNEVDGHASTSLTVAQMSNTVIYNTGQSAADIALTLPTAAAGLSAMFEVGTAQTNKWGVRAGATDKIYILNADGTISAGSDNGYARMTNAQVGQAFACWTFKTDAYDWMCKAVAIGTSTFAAN